MSNKNNDILEDIKYKIDELLEKAKGLGADAREEAEEAIQELRKQSEKLEDKMDDFKTKNEPKFEEAKFHIRKAAEELEHAFRKLFKKGPGAEEL